jgi:hypothetical protein
MILWPRCDATNADRLEARRPTEAQYRSSRRLSTGQEKPKRRKSRDREPLAGFVSQLGPAVDTPCPDSTLALWK